MKKKISFVLIIVLVVSALTLALAACDTHKCNDKCPECGLCLTECKESVCSKKCQGHDNGSGFTVTFVCDANVTVYVYKTQDMSAQGTKTTTAYSRDSETGAKLDDGNGQVNFKLVFANGYELKSMDITEGYNNLKGSAETGVTNGYRITKITDNLTVTITSQLEGTQEDLTQGFKVTFVTDEHVSVMVYRTQDMTSGGEQTNTAYSRESGTGTLTKDGGQVNFVLVFDNGYELNNITATTGTYKNIKYPSEIGVENGYRITQITGEMTVTITSKEEGAAEDLTNGYEVIFQCSDHVKIIVYKTQVTSGEGEETNTAHSRDGDNGSLLKDGKGQVNFKIVCDEGYEVLATNIVINGSYGNLKYPSELGENTYRITKITSALTITVTATVKATVE